ncbi:MAG: hypothetical protein ACRDV7_04225 [Acidimicrobiia bacterium]|jgi:hypothetical protein
MQRSALLVPTAAALVLAASCSSGPGPDVDDRTGAIYAATVRAVVGDRTTEDTDPGPVFVATARPEQSISLEVQAEMVEDLHDYATLRFVDERTEAILEDDPEQPVADEGVLVELGEIDEQGNTAIVDAERYENVDAQRHYRVRATRNDETWTATATAAPVSTG